MSAPETKSFCIGTFKISVYAAFAVFLHKQVFQTCIRIFHIGRSRLEAGRMSTKSASGQK
jgi:hypothetical protein